MQCVTVYLQTLQSSWCIKRVCLMCSCRIACLSACLLAIAILSNLINVNGMYTHTHTHTRTPTHTHTHTHHLHTSTHLEWSSASACVHTHIRIEYSSIANLHGNINSGDGYNRCMVAQYTMHAVYNECMCTYVILYTNY